MATIRDIARRAGVSVSTASLALNNDPRVRPQTRERVLEAAAALHYRPNRLARALSSGRTRSLQVLDPSPDGALSSGFFTRFLRGAHDRARERGYTVALSILDDEREAEETLERLIAERWTDGVVLMNPTEDQALLRRLLERRFPHVLLGRSSLAGVVSVDNDNAAAACDATLHLLAANAAPLLLLDGPAELTFAQDRAEGFRRAHRQRGAGLDERLVRFGATTPEAARAEVARLLDQGVRFGGVLAVSDAQALGVLQELRGRGLSVPGEVAVVGMNNDDLSAYVEPQLSSVDLDARRLGREAAELLIDTIEAEPDAAGAGHAGSARRIVPHRLVVRASSRRGDAVPSAPRPPTRRAPS